VARNVVIRDTLTGRSWRFDEVSDGVSVSYGIPWGVYEIPPAEISYTDGSMKKTLSNSLRLKERVLPDVLDPLSYIFMFILMFLIPALICMWEVLRK